MGRQPRQYGLLRQRGNHGLRSGRLFHRRPRGEGVGQFAYKWLGATWHFANTEHQQTFAATPIRYAPQYGGLCALGVANGERSVNVDPEAWRIVDGKLYLFFGNGGLEQDWDPHPEAVVAKADANWPAIEAKLAAR